MPMPERTRKGIYGEPRKRGIGFAAVLAGGAPRLVFVRPNVRVKPAPTAWLAGQQAHDGPQALRLMAGVPRRPASAGPAAHHALAGQRVTLPVPA